MAEEIVLALIGLGVFSLGRVLERKVGDQQFNDGADPLRHGIFRLADPDFF